MTLIPVRSVNLASSSLPYIRPRRHEELQRRPGEALVDRARGGGARGGRGRCGRRRSRTRAGERRLGLASRSGRRSTRLWLRCVADGVVELVEPEHAENTSALMAANRQMRLTSRTTRTSHSLLLILRGREREVATKTATVRSYQASRTLAGWYRGNVSCARRDFTAGPVCAAGAGCASCRGSPIGTNAWRGAESLGGEAGGRNVGSHR